MDAEQPIDIERAVAGGLLTQPSDHGAEVSIRAELGRMRLLGTGVREAPP
jgi:hypothetical protein